MIRFRDLGFLAALLLGIAGWLAAAEPSASDVVYQNGVVAADHPSASEAGAEILRKGGNVVDAAVATSFALSVVRPASCGLGGGGFMVIWNAAEKKAIALDYRERAPKTATRMMFANQNNDERSDPPSQKGPLAVAVPGTVAGLCYALKNYGTLDLPTVLGPAIRLAREGVPVDPHDLETRTATLKQFAERPDHREKYRGLLERYLNGGSVPKLGERIPSPQLRALELVAAHGPEAFYKGEVAEAIVAEMRRSGGLITRDDLAAMRPVVRQPLQGEFAGYDVLTMPPPSSGGVALLEMLNVLRAYEAAHPRQRLETLGRNSADGLQLLTECMKHAFADRAEFLGDTDFVQVPIQRLLSQEHARHLAARIDLRRTLPPEAYGRFQGVNDGGTSHFSVIDRHGNAVACTETINTTYGSWVVEPRFGIILNNQMDDFAAVPGKPNAFGLIQSEANAVAPGKKPLSSMTPTVLVRDGKAVFALGASGGPRIISATFQVLLNLTRFDPPPSTAVAQPRIHHQWLPNELLMEPPLFRELGEGMRRRGHEVKSRGELAVSQAVSRQSDGLRGGSDPRKHGRPAGY